MTDALCCPRVLAVAGGGVKIHLSAIDQAVKMPSADEDDRRAAYEFRYRPACGWVMTVDVHDAEVLALDECSGVEHRHG